MARRRIAPGSPAPQSQRSKTPAFRRRARLLLDAFFGRALFLMSESTAIPAGPRDRSAEGSLVQNGSRALVGRNKRSALRHSGRAATAARAGIHTHRLWLWIPGSRLRRAPE